MFAFILCYSVLRHIHPVIILSLLVRFHSVDIFLVFQIPKNQGVFGGLFVFSVTLNLSLFITTWIKIQPQMLIFGLGNSM